MSDFIHLCRKFKDEEKEELSYIDRRYKFDKDIEGYKRLCAEIILSSFNDILPYKYYQYHIIKWLKSKSIYSKKLLDKHHRSINWLLNERDHFAFHGLGIENYSVRKIQQAIQKRFNGCQKFNKTSLDRPKRIFYDS